MAERKADLGVLTEVRGWIFSRRHRFATTLIDVVAERAGFRTVWPDVLWVVTEDEMERALDACRVPIRDQLARAGFARVESANTVWEIYHRPSLVAGEEPYELVLPLPEGGYDHPRTRREYAEKARNFIAAMEG